LEKTLPTPTEAHPERVSNEAARRNRNDMETGWNKFKGDEFARETRDVHEKD
jgi:hypothetical protein